MSAHTLSSEKLNLIAAAARRSTVRLDDGRSCRLIAFDRRRGRVRVELPSGARFSTKPSAIAKIGGPDTGLTMPTKAVS